MRAASGNGPGAKGRRFPRGYGIECVRLVHPAESMNRCAAESGHLVIFDRTEGRRWEDKVLRREERAGYGAVTVRGM